MICLIFFRQIKKKHRKAKLPYFQTDNMQILSTILYIWYVQKILKKMSYNSYILLNIGICKFACHIYVWCIQIFLKEIKEKRLKKNLPYCQTLKFCQAFLSYIKIKNPLLMVANEIWLSEYLKTKSERKWLTCVTALYRWGRVCLKVIYPNQKSWELLDSYKRTTGKS